ncbi:hypothetical protein COHA_006191 [Chlorella ohadii]|uniref:Methyltransferase type 11 domain-containing protein n=1 Tax=Chlorella ohadii TaxID=2649997 RepID=A0AAD5DQC5_9CHLO|nr:hypothetical protein COHA_006191 [Chlorella ohadii]
MNSSVRLGRAPHIRWLLLDMAWYRPRYGDGARCTSGTYNKMLCERCQQENLNLNSCTPPAWHGVAPACSGECNVGDRVVWRATSKSGVPADQAWDGAGGMVDLGASGHRCSATQTRRFPLPCGTCSDPGGFGASCWGGWKVRCSKCELKSLLGSEPGGGLNGTTPYVTSCTAPKNGMVWNGTPVAAFSGVKTYAACCQGKARKEVAVSLAATFQHVVAQDSSASQIAAAQPRPNIRYEQAPAEASGLADGSVDLITAAQCMHWFDAPRFYAECRRALKPTGALAVFSYIPLQIHFPGNKAASEVLQKCLLDSNPFFDQRRQRFVLQLFKGQEPTADDFRVVETAVVEMQRERSVEQIVGWCQSMSGWAAYEAAHSGAADRLAADLQAVLGVDACTPVPMVWPLTMLLAKQPRPLR